jgi:hypothetical protein
MIKGNYMEILDKQGFIYTITLLKKKIDISVDNKIKDLKLESSESTRLEISAIVNNQVYYHIFDKEMKRDNYIVQVHDSEGNILLPRITKSKTSMLLEFLGSEIKNINILVIGG